jgi:hypothetical protein
MATISRRSCKDCSIPTRHFAVIPERPRYSAERCTAKCDLSETGNVEGIFEELYNFERTVVFRTADVTHLVFRVRGWEGEESS